MKQKRILIAEPNQEELIHLTLQVGEWGYLCNGVPGIADVRVTAESARIDCAIVTHPLDGRIPADITIRMLRNRIPDLPVIVLVNPGLQFHPNGEPGVVRLLKPIVDVALKAAIANSLLARPCS